MSERCPFGKCDGSGLLLDFDSNTAHDCDCRPQRISRAKAHGLSAVIPRRYQGVSFDRPPVTEIDPTVVREVRRYVASIEERLDEGRGLWLSGDVGTGKTTLAMLVSKAALDRSRSVAIYSMPRLLAEIRKTYDDSSERSYLELLERLVEVDLLHLDDLGVERSNDWVLEQLYAVVNTRYEDKRAIVITTNLNFEELRSQITERTVSRLVEMCGDQIPLHGNDARMELRPS